MTEMQQSGWDVLRRLRQGDPPAVITLDMWVGIRGVIVRHGRDRKRVWVRDLKYADEYNAVCVRHAPKTCHSCPARCQARLTEFRHALEDFLYTRTDVTDLLRTTDRMIELFTALVYYGPPSEQLKCEEVQEVYGNVCPSDRLTVPIV
jgi:hypothetical protein